VANSSGQRTGKERLRRRIIGSLGQLVGSVCYVERIVNPRGTDHRPPKCPTQSAAARPSLGKARAYQGHAPCRICSPLRSRQVVSWSPVHTSRCSPKTVLLRPPRTKCGHPTRWHLLAFPPVYSLREMLERQASGSRCSPKHTFR